MYEGLGSQNPHTHSAACNEVKDSEATLSGKQQEEGEEEKEEEERRNFKIYM